MSYGQSNIILLIINIVSYISVILELICDILDLNLGKIQLQFTAIYNLHQPSPVRHERHLCEENSSAEGACSDRLKLVDQHKNTCVKHKKNGRYHVR